MQDVEIVKGAAEIFGEARAAHGRKRRAFFRGRASGFSSGGDAFDVAASMTAARKMQPLMMRRRWRRRKYPAVLRIRLIRPELLKFKAKRTSDFLKPHPSDIELILFGIRKADKVAGRFSNFRFVWDPT
jgi:hypothetical protein